METFFLYPKFLVILVTTKFLDKDIRNLSVRTPFLNLPDTIYKHLIQKLVF